MKMLKSKIAICAVALFVSGCAADVNTRGNLVSDTKITQVKPNVTTQYDITRLFGPPTLTSPFAEDRRWYYAGQTTERLGIFKHEVIETKVVQVDFDENGVVTQVAELNPDATQDVDFVERTTSTAGKEYTILQQLIGNVGRFNGAGAMAERANQ